MEAGNLVDVGIPTYGKPLYLAEAVESVVAQRFESWRLTVHENGLGNPEIAAVLAPYLEDPRVQHRVSGDVVPAHANFSRTIRIGAAPYVGLLHDDDRWHPDYLANRVELLEADPSCGFAFSPIEEIDGDSQVIGERPYLLPQGVHQPRELVPLLYEGNIVATPTPLVRRSAYETVGPTFTSRFPHLTDYEMWFRLAVRFPVGYLNVRDCGARIHQASETSKHERIGLEYLEFFAYMEKEIARELPGLYLDPKVVRRKHSYAHVKASLDALEEGDRREALHHLRRALRVYPATIADPRVGASLVALLGGERGLAVLSRVRSFVLRHGVRIHRRRQWPL